MENNKSIRNTNLIAMKAVVFEARSRFAEATKYRAENEHFKTDGNKQFEDALNDLLNVYETALTVYANDGFDSDSFYIAFGKEILELTKEHQSLVAKNYPDIWKMIPHIESLGDIHKKLMARAEEAIELLERRLKGNKKMTKTNPETKVVFTLDKAFAETLKSEGKLEDYCLNLFYEPATVRNMQGIKSVEVIEA